ncbi:MAG: glycosyltransferase family 1 protein [Candidatus Falkowbacteria bacterium]
MKIGVDIRVLMDKQYSGISEYAYYLLKELLAREDDNEYVFYYNSFKKLDEHFLDWDSPKITFKNTSWPNKIFNYILQKFLDWPKLDSVTGPVDVFWSPHLNFSCFGQQAGKKILTVHDLSFLRYPEFFSNRKNLWHKGLNVKKLVRKYDTIVAISENTKVDLMELLHVPEEKIIVIYSGLNQELNDLSPASINSFKSRHEINSRFILYLGAIEPRKNVAGLIEAYNLMRDRHFPLTEYQLLLAGASGWKNKHIYKKAEDSLYRDDIRFLGYVSRQERDWLYTNASLFVYPSYYEGFGFPPLEAMSRGLATITSDISSLPEVTGDAALLINPYSALDLARGMETMLLDSDLRKRYSEKGLERSKLFSWSKTADNYLKLFKK